MSKDVKSVSKFLSLVLRHKPEILGITLDPQGWVALDVLVQASNGRLSVELVQEVVASNDKQRFAMSPDGLRIRAHQGHTVSVDLDLQPCTPPQILYHGTYVDALDQIRIRGLHRMERHHVHLTEDANLARKTGSRRGPAVLLQIDAGQMFKDGLIFYCTANKVWLTEHVALKYFSTEGLAEGNDG